MGLHKHKLESSGSQILIQWNKNKKGTQQKLLVNIICCQRADYKVHRMAALFQNYTHTNIHTKAREKVLKVRDQRSANIFWKGSDSKYFRLWRLPVCHHSSAPQLAAVTWEKAQKIWARMSTAVFPEGFFVSFIFWPSPWHVDFSSLNKDQTCTLCTGQAGKLRRLYLRN